MKLSTRSFFCSDSLEIVSIVIVISVSYWRWVSHEISSFDWDALSALCASIAPISAQEWIELMLVKWVENQVVARGENPLLLFKLNAWKAWRFAELLVVDVHCIWKCWCLVDLMFMPFCHTWCLTHTFLLFTYCNVLSNNIIRMMLLLIYLWLSIFFNWQAEPSDVNITINQLLLELL